jgi:hypothetical protein
MDVVANSRNKMLYKIQLYLLKVIPMVMTFICLINSILSYYNIDLPILSYLGSCSVLMLIYLYIASYVFKFCKYHRMFLHYIVVTTILNTYDYYIGIPLTDLQLLLLYLIVFGVFLFIILYLYVTTNKRTSAQYY